MGAGGRGREAPTRKRCKTNPISSVGQGPGGRNLQNEANLAHPRQGLDRQKMQNEPNFPAAALGRAAANRAKQSQLAPGRCRAGTPNLQRRENVQNEANSQPCQVGRGLGSAGRLCKTNPISPRRAGKTIPKASDLEAATRAESNRAKRTQFACGAGRQGHRHSQLCKTNPISEEASGVRWTEAQSVEGDSNDESEMENRKSY